MKKKKRLFWIQVLLIPEFQFISIVIVSPSVLPDIDHEVLPALPSSATNAQQKSEEAPLSNGLTFPLSVNSNVFPDKTTLKSKTSDICNDPRQVSTNPVSTTAIPNGLPNQPLILQSKSCPDPYSSIRCKIIQTPPTDYSKLPDWSSSDSEYDEDSSDEDDNGLELFGVKRCR